jgi:hypothetical protein
LVNEGFLQLGSSQNGGSYAIRFNDVVMNLKRQNAENIVEQKYGGINFIPIQLKSDWGKNLSITFDQETIGRKTSYTIHHVTSK